MLTNKGLGYDMTNKQADIPKLPCPADTLIPHDGVMQLIDCLQERSEDRKTAVATVSLTREHLFIGAENQITCEFFIEIIAQTAAAANGFDALMDERKTGPGFLVRVDDFSLFHHQLSDEQLRAKIEEIFVFNDMTIVKGELFCGNNLLASGRIQVWEEQKQQ